MNHAELKEIAAWHFLQLDAVRKQIRETPHGDTARISELDARYKFHVKAANGLDELADAFSTFKTLLIQP